MISELKSFTLNLHSAGTVDIRSTTEFALYMELLQSLSNRTHSLQPWTDLAKSYSDGKWMHPVSKNRNEFRMEK